ncbi:TetR/AcrR family transcriptional regulator [Nocardioides sp. YIM 152588]|uniref:TetR/AcrR family transcriptional regulator n=1 Tax=Nocardioides sp. YIM 152588 TaxID=3158259 RepID=UPI0032E52F07
MTDSASKPGRPAGPATETRDVVLNAALDLLLREGGAALTAQRLHQATGVSRSTIYRHWPSPVDVLAALIEVAPSPERASLGDPRADLHAEVDALGARLRDRPVAAFLRALAATTSPGEDAVVLRHRYVDDLVAPFRRVLANAGLAQEDTEDVVAAVVAPLLVDALLMDRPAGLARAHRTVDRLLPG